MTRLPEPLTFRTDRASGSVHRYGAHVMSWQPAGTEPVVWVSRLAHQEQGRPIRGGVPLCFPWFGPGLNRQLSPQHGFGRISTWRAAPSPDESSTACFELTETDVDPQLREVFPYRFHARFTVVFDTELRMSLQLRNTDEREFVCEQALHTYFHVGDAREIELTGLAGQRYHDKVTDTDHVQDGPLRITGETDLVFQSTDTVQIDDPVLGRTVHVAKEGSASTVVWNPWVEKAREMTDFADDEWPHMVCVETANVLGDALRLGPGQSHTLTQRVRVSSD